MDAFPTAERDSVVPITLVDPLVHKRSATGIGQLALPYPNGWFAVSFSHQLLPEQVVRVPFMGQELVLYRTASGVARAIDPYCPHLGAHLGHGGKVVGEELVCPFHGLAFNPQGLCVRTAGGQKPPAAALTQRYIAEIDDVIFVWRHQDDRPPFWQLPALDRDGFSQGRYEKFLLQGLCQDMTENSADPLHFAYLHGLQEVVTQHREEEHQMTYTMQAKVFGQAVSMKMRCYGLGYAVGEASFPRLGLVARTQALGTQITPLSWDFRMIDTLRVERVARLPQPLQRYAYAVLLLYVHRWFVKTVKEDFAVWSNRRYIAQPRLIAGEGNMAVYRRWALQFYPDNGDIE
ncbi:Rieske 2Fe-2S domain-containing protein [Serratia entomophila]|uniref:Rieske 2Fe-2S domain-containing protein n=1 Tax=Serratia entomophila TaxID=42906 RepID=UPI00217A8E8A|nr:Rieske 2Fe-2S domain-containing protein [Serratia entomophila]CAI0849509.1 3-ketosteroid-9-alpha-hydroxylase oxygenase subunit [Serratia entomophila]CAI1529978.1 3-ketosteroid-9-alpha-hydroxylase oxygenase subunit [Serratia entomophila]CAI1567560.1 3-ketosteroid-9-alpha-hydroxylase oxygenase subunit [Serratia entomophila]CAI1697807.1 3-ketosteroid-9-alpha-hydroxylase oxygenase subunit [Serratia entomophila]CAI1717864.1 3-ketosteroid-9-alpha-hydroxylase oxygenase subunit [Serratia entomophil